MFLAVNISMLIFVRLLHFFALTVLFAILAISSGAWAQSSVTGVNTLSTTLPIGANGKVVMTVYDDGTDGFVGIGTTSPLVPLTVANGGGGSALDGGEIAQFAQSGNAYITIRGTASHILLLGYEGQADLGTFTNDALNLMVNNSSRMVINTSGYVGIGTTSPQSLFHVRVGTDQNLWVHTPATVSPGAELATVNDAVSALEPMELRASLFDFTGGNVGIGTTVPGTKLDVNGAVTMRGMSAPSVSASGQSIIYFDSTANVLKISQNGAAYTPLSASCRTCAFECTAGGAYGCVTTPWVCSAYSSGNVQQNTASGGSITTPYEIGIQCQ